MLVTTEEPGILLLRLTAVFPGGPGSGITPGVLLFQMFQKRTSRISGTGFLRARYPSRHPTISVKELKENKALSLTSGLASSFLLLPLPESWLITQSTDPDQWPGLIPSSSTTGVLTHYAKHWPWPVAWPHPFFFHYRSLDSLCKALTLTSGLTSSFLLPLPDSWLTTQSTKPNQWPGVILSSSTTGVLTRYASHARQPDVAGVMEEPEMKKKENLIQ